MVSDEDLLALKAELSRKYLGRSMTLERARKSEFRFCYTAANCPGAENIHGIGIRRAPAGGSSANGPGIVFLISDLLEALEHNLVPAEFDGIPVELLEAPLARVGGPECSMLRKSRIRPVVAGTSAGLSRECTGTIGCFCRSTDPADDPDDIFVLSNSHVFANCGIAKLGAVLYQPGPFDGGEDESNTFAHLYRTVMLRCDGSTANTIDAAIGRLAPGVQFGKDICDIGPVRGVEAPVEGMTVLKHGRTTGMTSGEIDLEALDLHVIMSHQDDGKVALMVDQIRIKPLGMEAFAAAGDSGALVINPESNAAVGLLFATAGVFGIANKLPAVLSGLQLALAHI
jgi:hypothetical protein